MTFHIKQGDTAPPAESTLTLDGAVQGLAGTTVEFLMTPKGSDTATVDAAATIVDEDAGEVKYEWSAGDTDTIGYYDAEWKVTFNDGDVMRFPNDGYETVRVHDALD